MQKSDIRSAVAVEPGKLIEGRGKIFFKAGYLFVNEPGNGVHVIDNRNPQLPANVAFIKVPGSFDITVKDDLLFTDSYMDLVTFDISDLGNIREVNRLEDFFWGHGQYAFSAGTANAQVIVDYVEESREEVSDHCDAAPFQRGFFMLEDSRIMASTAFDAGAGGQSAAPGIAGSLARFALSDDHLYMLDEGFIKNLDLSTPLSPQPGEELYVAWDVETLFPPK